MLFTPAFRHRALQPAASDDLPWANTGGETRGGGGRRHLSFPCHPLPASCQAEGTFSCLPSPRCLPHSFTQHHPRSIPPSWRGLPPAPCPVPAGGGTHRSDAAAWYGWLRQRMECPQPWPMAPHASAALPGGRRGLGCARFSVLAGSGTSRRARRGCLQLAAVTEPDAARRGVREGRAEGGGRGGAGGAAD